MATTFEERYISWVQRSLNRLLDAKLKVNGFKSGDYSFWINEFQLGHGLPQIGDVDYDTQNAIIKANHIDPIYVDWVFHGLKSAGQTISVSSTFGIEPVRKQVRSFQDSKSLQPDGWVGPITENALSKASKTVVPGGFVPPRPIRKVKPRPKTIRPIHSLEERFRRLTKRMHFAVQQHHGPKISVRQRKRLLCFLRKLTDKTADDMFITPHGTGGNAHGYVNGGEFSHENGSSPDDIAYSARKRLKSYLRKNMHRDMNDLFDEYQIEVAELFDLVNEGIVKIDNMYQVKGDDSAAAKRLFIWTKKKQENDRAFLKPGTKTSILACFAIS